MGGVRHHPQAPDVAHVWVRGRADHGAPTPGVVAGWQWSGVHNATASGWMALVVTAPFGDALLVAWVEAERLVPVRDPAPRA